MSAAFCLHLYRLSTVVSHNLFERTGGARRVEAGHSVRLVRDPHHHAGRDFLQHAQEGRVVDGEDARP